MILFSGVQDMDSLLSNQGSIKLTSRNLQRNTAMRLFIGEADVPSSSCLDFETWYHPDICHYLLQLVDNKARCLRVIFNDAGYGNNTETFKDQLEALIVLANYFNRPAVFIAKEPGAENHFMAGLLKGNQLLFINPLGMTTHQDCYQTLAELQKVNILGTIWLSTNALQRRNYEEALVSCGPISIELIIHILKSWNFDDINNFWSQLKSNETTNHEKTGLQYVGMTIEALLPQSLKNLLKTSSKWNYQQQMLQIRQVHYQLLENKPKQLAAQRGLPIDSYLQQLKEEAPSQELFNMLVTKHRNVLDIQTLPAYNLLKEELIRDIQKINPLLSTYSTPNQQQPDSVSSSQMVNSIPPLELFHLRIKRMQGAIGRALDTIELIGTWDDKNGAFFGSHQRLREDIKMLLISIQSNLNKQEVIYDKLMRSFNTNFESGNAWESFYKLTLVKLQQIEQKVQTAWPKLEEDDTGHIRVILEDINDALQTEKLQVMDMKDRLARRFLKRKLNEFTKECRNKIKPTVFISYSWDNNALNRRVCRLAKDLKKTGIEVILDIWHNRSGSVMAFIEYIKKANIVVIVGTPGLVTKWKNYTDSPQAKQLTKNSEQARRLNIVALEIEKISKRILEPEDNKYHIINVLLAGSHKESFPSLTGYNSSSFFDISKPGLGNYIEPFFNILGEIFPNNHQLEHIKKAVIQEYQDIYINFDEQEIITRYDHRLDLNKNLVQGSQSPIKEDDSEVDDSWSESNKQEYNSILKKNYESITTQAKLYGHQLSLNEIGNFLNLQIMEYCVRDHKQQENDLAQHTTAKASHERLYRVTKPIKIEELFNERTRIISHKVSEPFISTRVLIEGQAGVGKSTLLEYICKCWIQEKTNLFKQYTWVWLIRLRDLMNEMLYDEAECKQRIKEGSIIPYIIYQSFFKKSGIALRQFIEDWESFIQRKQLDREPMLFLLDGYDELHYVSHPWLKEVVENYLLDTNYHTILSTRTTHVGKMQDNKVLHVEIMGFSDEHVKQYIRLYFATHREQENIKQQEIAANQLIENLQIHSSIWNLAHLPVNLEIICLILEKNPQINFDTTTSLYQKLLMALYQRYLKRENKEFELMGITEDILLAKSYIQILAKQAWRMMQEGVYVCSGGKLLEMNGADTKENLSTIKILLDIGFIKQSGNNESIIDNKYYFPHLTYQEFFAAIYLATQLKNYNSQFIIQQEFSYIKFNPRYQLLLKFIAGLLNNQLTALSHYLDQLQEVQSMDLLQQYEPGLLASFYEEISNEICQSLRQSLLKKIKNYINKLFVWFKHNKNMTRGLSNSLYIRVLRNTKSLYNQEVLWSLILNDLKKTTNGIEDIILICDFISFIGVACEAAIDKLADYLDHENEDIRFKVVWTISQLNKLAITPRVLQKLAKYLGNEKEYVREGAAWAISLIEAASRREVTDKLSSDLKSKDRHIRSRGLEAIRRFREATLPQEILIAIVENIIHANNGRELDKTIYEMGAIVRMQMVPLLITYLDHEDEDKCLNALNTMCNIHLTMLTPEIAEKLIKNLMTQNNRIFIATAQIILNLDELTIIESSALPILVERLINDRETQVQFITIQAISKFGKLAASPSIFQELFKWLNEGTEKVRFAAAKAIVNLSMIADKPDILKQLLGYLEHKEEELSKAVAGIINDLTINPDILQQLITCQSKEETVCLAIIRVIRKCKKLAVGTEILSKLMGYLEYGIEVQLAAVQVIGELESASDPEIVRFLIKYLEDDDERVRFNTAETIAKLSGAITELTVLQKLIECFENKTKGSFYIINQTINILSKTLKPTMLQQLIQYLQQRENTVRATLLRIISEFTRLTANRKLPQLVKEFEYELTKYSTITEAISKLCIAIHTVEMWQQLIKCLHEGEKEIRSVIDKTMVTTEVGFLLNTCLKHKDNQLIDLLIYGVNQFGTTAITPDLLARFEKYLNDKDNNICKMALIAVSLFDITMVEDTILQKLVDCLKRDNEIQPLAIETVVKLANITIIPVISEKLSKCLDFVQDEAQIIPLVQAIGGLGVKFITPTIVTKLNKCLKTNNISLKRAAVMTIAKLGRVAADFNTLTELKDCLKNKTIVKIAIQAIGNLDVLAEKIDVFEELTSCLENNDQEVRNMAADAISKLLAEEASLEKLITLNKFFSRCDSNLIHKIVSSISFESTLKQWIGHPLDNIAQQSLAFISLNILYSGTTVHVVQNRNKYQLITYSEPETQLIFELSELQANYLRKWLPIVVETLMTDPDKLQEIDLLPQIMQQTTNIPTKVSVQDNTNQINLEEKEKRNQLQLIIQDGIRQLDNVGNNIEPERYLKTADLYVQSNFLDDAIIQYEKYLQLKPLAMDVYLSLARCYHATGDLIKSQKAFQKAIENNPNSESFLEYGHFLVVQNDYWEAVTLLQMALALAGDNREIRYSIMNQSVVQLYLQQDIMINGEMKALSKLLAYYLLVISYKQLGDDIALTQYLQELMEEVSTRPTALGYRLLDYAYQQLDNEDEALFYRSLARKLVSAISIQAPSNLLTTREEPEKKLKDSSLQTEKASGENHATQLPYHPSRSTAPDSLPGIKINNTGYGITVNWAKIPSEKREEVQCKLEDYSLNCTSADHIKRNFHQKILSINFEQPSYLEELIADLRECLEETVAKTFRGMDLSRLI